MERHRHEMNTFMNSMELKHDMIYRKGILNRVTAVLHIVMCVYVIVLVKYIFCPILASHPTFK